MTTDRNGYVLWFYARWLAAAGKRLIRYPAYGHTVWDADGCWIVGCALVRFVQPVHTSERSY